MAHVSGRGHPGQAKGPTKRTPTPAAKGPIGDVTPPRVLPAADWPAPAPALEAGRGFLRWAAAGRLRVVIVSDRDVDGLSAGLLVARALERLGCPPPVVMPTDKGEHVHGPVLRARLAAIEPEALVVVDTGSRNGAILDAVPTLLIDHHQPHGFPTGAVVVSAYGHHPVAPTALLAWELVRPLADLGDEEWLAVIGTVADLGTELPFPETAAALRRLGRKAVAETVALVNAARRAEQAVTVRALEVLRAARSPADIAAGRVAGVDALRRCRAEVQSELARCGRAAPRFAGRYALVRVSSPVQVHPLLAARWSRRLPRYVVIVANDGYIPGRVNFSMRTKLDVNLVDLLRSIPLPGAEGEWGFGHPAASGGSLAPPDFTRLLAALGFAAA